ncbi:MAG: VOC family protein [Pseudomonadota bacterium]
MDKSDLTFDHVGLWCSDLEASARRFAAMMHVEVEAGGRHQGQGTWNRLVGAVNGVYLELIARDPEQETAGPMVQAVGAQADLTSCLAAYRTSDLEGVYARAMKLGATSRGVQTMSRAGGDGTTISWRLLFLQHPDHPVLPFFIDWQSTPHPSSRLKPALSIGSPVFQSPDPDGLEQLLAGLGVRAQIVHGERPEIIASVRNGTVSASASGTRSLSTNGTEPE